MTTGLSPLITDYDLYLFGEGNHTRIYDRLGAHLIMGHGAGHGATDRHDDPVAHGEHGQR